jgi:hypothetical protein
MTIAFDKLRQPTRARTVLLVAILLGLFVSYRWFVRAEPLNSDDLALFRQSTAFAQGTHFLLRSPETFADNSASLTLTHFHFRIGLLPFSVPAIWLFGRTYLSYYLVPLLFSLGGFALTWYVMHREIHPGFALAFALVHLVLPFEVIDSCRFLVDVPAATASLLSLVLIARWSDFSSASTSLQFARGGVAGLIMLESYLLRENQLVILVPAFLLFLSHKHTRTLTVGVGITLLVGVFLEHLLYFSKGFEWDIRWITVNKDKIRWLPYFPTYTFWQFPVREFTFLLRRFEGWPDGVFAVAFYGAALLSQLLMLWRTPSLLLRAVALLGLSTWGFFSFAIVDFVEGGVRAVAPSGFFRYFQPFFYSAIISLCWLTTQLYQTAARWRLREPRPWRHWSRQVLMASAFAVPIGLAGMSMRLSAIHFTPLTRPSGELWQALQFLDRQAALAIPQLFEVYGSGQSLEGFSLFRGPWSRPPVQWHILPLRNLAPLAQRRIPQFVVQDVFQERIHRRYRKERSPQDSKGIKGEDELMTFRRALWDHYTPVAVLGRYNFHYLGSTPPPPQLLPNGDFREADVSNKKIPHWSLTTRRITLSRSPTGHLAISLHTIPQVSLYSGNSTNQHTPPTDTALYSLGPDFLYTFRVSLQFDDSFTAYLSILQYDATQQIAIQNFSLESGDNYLTIAPDAAAQSYRLAVQLRPTRSATSSAVEFVDVSIRRYTRQEKSPQQVFQEKQETR